jgi:tetratricopeptide (TPR) repeat protein
VRKILLLALLILLAGVGQSSALSDMSASGVYNKGNKLFAEAKYAEALLAYQSALAGHSKDVSTGDVHSRIGDCYFRLQDYKNALKAYRSALQDQNQSQRAPTQYWIGFCTFLLGKDGEAVAEFLKIPELYPSSGMWIGTAYYWAGRASERMGRKEQAAEYYRKAGGNGKSTQGKFAMKKAEGIGLKNSGGRK